ncbi:hypothetical protein [Hymenobacter ruber]
MHVITPANVRAYEKEVVDSALILADDGLPATPGAATYGTIAGSPFDSVALAAALNRSPNHRPGGHFEAVYATDADATAFNDTGAVSLESLVRTRASLCHLRMPLTAELTLNGAGHDYTLVYDGAPRPAGTGLQVFKNGEMLPGDLVPAVLVPIDSPQTVATPYASVNGATYAWKLGQYASAYVGSPLSIQFFLPRAAGVHPAPAEGGDATHWEPVSPQGVVVPGSAPVGRTLPLDDARALQAAAQDGTDLGKDWQFYTIIRADGNVTVQWLPADGANDRPAGFSPVGIWQSEAGPTFATYDVDSDEVQPLDFARLSPVAVAASTGGLFGYQTIAAAVTSGQLVDATATLNANFTAPDQVLDSLLELRGNGNVLGGESGHPLALTASKVSDVVLYNTVLAAGRVFNSQLNQVEFALGADCLAFDCDFGAGCTASAGTLRIGAGCTGDIAGIATSGTGQVVDERTPALSTRDPYAVATGVRDAVRDPGNTWAYGDLTDFNDAGRLSAGAPPAVSGQATGILVGTADVKAGDCFDAFETGSTAVAWCYTYKRRNDGTSGWTRLPKTA